MEERRPVVQQPQGKSKCSEEIKPKMVAQAYNQARDEKEYWGLQGRLGYTARLSYQEKIWLGMVM